MSRKNGGSGDEPREPGRVPEEGFGADGAGKKTEEEWALWGAEDPAFFIKPSDGK